MYGVRNFGRRTSVLQTRRRMGVNRAMRRLCGLLFVAALVGCAASSPVRVDQADGVDLSRCRTFAWQAPTSEVESFTDRRVRQEVLAELERKGYTIAQTADCRITYVFAAHERPQDKPQIGVGAGGGSRGVGGGIGISIPIGKSDRFGGVLTLDVIDAEKNAQIWSGTVEASVSERELSDEDARKLVKEILARFPDRK